MGNRTSVSRIVGVLVACAGVVTACGDRSQVQTPGAAVADTTVVAVPGTDINGTVLDTSPGIEADTTIVADPGTDPVSPTDPAVATNPSVPVTSLVGGTVPSPYPPDLPPQTTITPALEEAITAANAVSGSDVVPAEIDADTDPAAADTAVRFAFQHWILLDIDKDVRASLMENGEVNTDAIDAQMQAASGLLGCARVAVESVHFVDAAHAFVPMWMLCNHAISSFFPSEIIGGAVFAEGTWRIDRSTICYLAFGAGQDCAGAVITTPTSATALAVTSIPAGFTTWPGQPPSVAIVDVPGFQQWSPSGDPTVMFSVQAEPLRGISELTAADTEAVLAAQRFGATAGAPIEIGTQPGRIATVDTSIALVFVRADDIVVQIRSAGLSEADILTIAAGILTG